MANKVVFKSPAPVRTALRAGPRNRPRTVAAARRSNPSIEIRPYEHNSSIKPGDDSLSALRMCDKSPLLSSEQVLSSSPARSVDRPSGRVEARFRLRADGKSQFLAANAGLSDDRLFHKRKKPDLRCLQDSEAGFEYTFHPLTNRDAKEALLKELLHEHNQLKARVLRQEEVLSELYGAHAPSLRLLNRGSTAKPQTRAVAHRSGSSLSGNQLRPPRPDSTATLSIEDSLKLAERRQSVESNLLPDAQNLDSVGRSQFLYPSPDGVFHNTSKRYQSAPRPSRFPKEVFPMLINRHRQTLD